MRRLECKQPIFVKERVYSLRPEMIKTASELVDCYAPSVFDGGACINLYYTSYEGHEAACNAMRAAASRMSGGVIDFFPNELKKACCTSAGGEEFVVLPMSAAESYDVLAGKLLHEFSHCRCSLTYLSGNRFCKEVELALSEHAAESKSLDTDPFAAAAASWSVHRESLPGMVRLAQKYQKRCLLSPLIIAQNFGSWNAHLTHDYHHKKSLLPVFERVISDYDRFNAGTLKPEEYKKYRHISEALLSEPLSRKLLEKELEPFASDTKETIWLRG